MQHQKRYLLQTIKNYWFDSTNCENIKGLQKKLCLSMITKRKTVKHKISHLRQKLRFNDLAKK